MTSEGYAGPLLHLDTIRNQRAVLTRVCALNSEKIIARGPQIRLTSGKWTGHSPAFPGTFPARIQSERYLSPYYGEASLFPVTHTGACMETVQTVRGIHIAKVDAATALELSKAGHSPRAIARMLGPDVSHLAVYRALRRARKQGESI